MITLVIVITLIVNDKTNASRNDLTEAGAYDNVIGDNQHEISVIETYSQGKPYFF